MVDSHALCMSAEHLVGRWLSLVIVVCNVLWLLSGNAGICSSMSRKRCQSRSLRSAILAKTLHEVVYCKFLGLLHFVCASSDFDVVLDVDLSKSWLWCAL